MTTPLSIAMVSGPVAADCGGDGVQWPRRAADAAGVTFIGTPTRIIEDVPEPGAASIEFQVERVFAGTETDELMVSPWCVGTAFDLGRRYLISTADDLGLPGVEPEVGGDQVWFSDTISVAWQVKDDGRVTLVGYGEGTPRAPAYLRDPATVEEAVRAILAGNGLPPTDVAPRGPIAFIATVSYLRVAATLTSVARDLLKAR